MTRLLLSLWVLLCWTCMWTDAARGQEDRPRAAASQAGIATSQPAGKNAQAQQARRRWEQMSEEAREKLLRRYERWKGLSEEERGQLKRNFEKWQQMTDEQKRALRRRHEILRRMPEEKRQELQRRMELIRRLPPEKRRVIFAFIQTLKRLPPERLRQIRQLPLPERKRVLNALLLQTVRALRRQGAPRAPQSAPTRNGGPLRPQGPAPGR